MKSFIHVCMAALIIVFFPGCGSKEDAAQKEAGLLEQMAKTAEQAQKSVEQMQNGPAGDKKPVPPVSFKVLMNFLPADVGGMKAADPSGETQTMGEWSFSNASARYTSADGYKNAKVEISDFAYIAPLYATYTLLFNMKFSRETMEGFERSTKINEYPAYEKWTTASKDGQTTVLIGERFIVVVETHGLDEGAARKVVENMDLKKLALQTAS